MEIALKNPCRAASVSVRMKSGVASDLATFFWKVKGGGPIDGKVSFDVPSGDPYKTHTVKLPEPTEITYLRFDPIRKPGKVWIEEIILQDEKGGETHKWSFK